MGRRVFYVSETMVFHPEPKAVQAAAVADLDVAARVVLPTEVAGVSEHSILSPSGASAWTLCEGMLAACKGKPDTSNEASARGTVQHRMAEVCLKGNHDATEAFLRSRREADGYTFIVDEEMCEQVQAYVDGIRRTLGRRYVEVGIDMTPVLQIPGQKGTSDAVVLNKSTNTIEVHDAKFGYHKVTADGNKQGLLYLAGAMHHFDIYHEWTHGKFAIHQPKVDHYDERTYTRAEIEEFVAWIRPIAKRVMEMYEGTRPIVLTPGPVQCQWCKIRGSCSARSKAVLDDFPIEGDAPEVPTLSDDELAGFLRHVEYVEGWCADIRKEARDRALAGTKVPGFKLIQGKKGRRYWKDKAEAEAALALALPPDVIYEPRELVSPAVLEKVMKKDFETVKPFVGQDDGALQLVPESAKGTEVQIGTIDDFATVSTE